MLDSLPCPTSPFILWVFCMASLMGGDIMALMGDAVSGGKVVSGSYFVLNKMYVNEETISIWRGSAGWHLEAEVVLVFEKNRGGSIVCNFF